MDKENERESQSDNTHLSTIAYSMRQKRERRVESERERRKENIVHYTTSNIHLFIMHSLKISHVNVQV